MIFVNLKVALAPMEIQWGEKSANIDKLEQIADKLHPETDLLIVPETFSTGFPTTKDKEEIRVIAEKNSGETIERVKQIARKHQIAIAGSFIADTGGSLSNRAFFIEPSGEEVFADKRHLFKMAGEDKLFSPGYNRLSVRYRGWNIAMIVCYDIRFPVWCRNKNNEYDLLIATANWPVARVAAWDTLLKARAIENLAYVAGVNCKGTDNNGFEYNGSSALYDFKGKDISVHTDDGILYASLDMETLTKFREKFPAWQDADPFNLA